ncbi:histone-lysine N-methyltransferase PRDM9-like isoform X5 [Mya arenaria]|uniref:histone-lysine N-methyltransferase PRDM9-like isoform X5 n=1 Tax=Mya arenaria TaxID=6604 RepID=UPI0022E33004|nr:histone-lysine N-methyltransferase PRDM9-like isoform X5 [Mya arenaria]
MHMEGLQYITNMGDELALERRVVIRSELNDLSTLLSKAGDECFIVTACVTDETPHLLGSIKGTGFVESKSLIVKTEFLQYLKNQVSSEVVSRPDVIDDQCSEKKVVRSLMIHLAGRLHADGEECFIVSANNPNVLGSDKGKAYFCENFKFCQKAFSRHIDDELMTDDELEAPDIKKHNENHGIRSDVSAGENKRATNTNGFEGTSDECKQGTNSYTLEIKSFTCVVKGCLREFIARWPLLKHYQSHTETKLITCRECDEQFKSSTTAIKHCRIAHPYNEKLQPQYPSRQRLEDLERQLIADNTDGRV